MLYPSSDSFANRLIQLRSLEGSAVRAFVEEYEPYIRRTVRFRLWNTALHPAADSVDVCQSVMSSFLLRLASGEYQLESEEALRKLLIAIANKKFLMLHRRESAVRRARHQTLSLSGLPEIVCNRSQSDQLKIEHEDLLAEFSRRLTTAERSLLERRRSGQSWSEIATELSVDAMILRKRFSRALQRVADELGIDY